MAFNISGASIRNPIPSLVLFAVLLVLGIFAFRALPITNSPNIDIPVVDVTITESGAAPAELEAQVTKKVEDAVAGVNGVKHITSTVTDGVSLTEIELRLEISSDRALNEVRDAISTIRAELPRTIDEPIIQRLDFSSQPIQTYAASAPGMTLEQLSWFIDDTVARSLQGLPGVGRVQRIGGVTREIQVMLDPDRLSALGITAGDVNAQVQQTSVDLAGGRGELGAREQMIRTLAGATTIQGLANTRIVLPGGREIRLQDLGTVSDAAEEPRIFARMDGQTPVVAFRISRSKNGQRSRCRPSRRRPPENPRRRSSRRAVQAHRRLRPFLRGRLQIRHGGADRRRGAGHPGRAAVPARLACHPAVRRRLAAVRAARLRGHAADGFTLNFISLLAITLVTGILVDDAIVEIENIVRHIRMGKRPYDAAIEAADEIGLAVIAITLTICAVFAPVSFMGGIAGQYFKQFGLTVAAAVLCSLLVARLITPLMAAYLLRPHAAGGMTSMRARLSPPTRVFWP